MPKQDLNDEQINNLLPKHLRLVYFLWRQKKNLLDFYSFELVADFRNELFLYGFEIDLENSFLQERANGFNLKAFPDWIHNQNLLRPFESRLEFLIN